MPDTDTNRPDQPVDLRIYLGMVLFRWQIIAVCLLYGLLGGVLIVQLTPKKYVVNSILHAYVDPSVKVPGYQSTANVLFHMKMLRSGDAVREAVANLSPVWGKKLGDPSKLRLPLILKPRGGRGIHVQVRCDNPKYGRAFLEEVMSIHQKHWENQSGSRGSVTEERLLTEMSKLDELIREADDEVNEYMRLHDVRRTKLRGTREAARLASLVGQRHALETRMWMMEVMFPALKEENIAVIQGADRFADSIAGATDIADSKTLEGLLDEGAEAEGFSSSPEGTEGIVSLREGPEKEGETERERGYANLRYELANLREEEQEVLTNLTPEHQRVKTIQKRIQEIEEQLRLSAEMELWRMRDRYKTMQVVHDAVEAAEYRWQAKDLIEMKKTAELNRKQAKVKRLEASYQTLYNRLLNLQMSREVDADRFWYSPPAGPSKPVWPDVQKILLIALAVGLSSGFGLAVAAQVLDNKVQSIKDVEDKLGIPFLGGIPFWAHSGLERTIRPIVTEEHSSGAVEAYRSLRTSVLASLAKAKEKILLVTSADSREGKTLTALNLAILVSQMNKRVLLVDMDLRRGRLHRSLGLDKEPGVSDVLREHLNLRDVITATRIDNLHLAPPGRTIEDAPELLQSFGVDSIFVDVQDDYDYIIVDTSPVLRVTDSVIMASQGYGVVMLVARVNHTPKPLIRYALEMLKDARLIGMVLNSIEMHKISSLYYTYQYPNYAYYSNAYSYGYSYAYYGDLADKEKRFRRRGGGGLRSSLDAAAKWARETFLPME